MADVDLWRAGKYLRGADLASSGNAHFELKKVIEMPMEGLHHLHGATMEVEVEVLGNLRSVTGKSRYDARDPDLGPVLRIQVSDPMGDFELLLVESTWNGLVESSNLPGCDYRVSFKVGQELPE
jgi:hypothetical protein